MLEIYGLNSNVTLGSYCFSNSDVKGENVLHYEKIFNPLFGNEIIILSDVKDGIFLEISDVLWRPLDITQNNHHVTLLGVVQSSQKAEQFSLSMDVLSYITHFQKWELAILLYNSWCKIVGLELVECFLQYVEKKGKKLPMHKKIPTTISDHLKKIKEIIHSPNIDMH